MAKKTRRPSSAGKKAEKKVTLMKAHPLKRVPNEKISDELKAKLMVYLRERAGSARLKPLQRAVKRKKAVVMKAKPKPLLQKPGTLQQALPLEIKLTTTRKKSLASDVTTTFAYARGPFTEDSDAKVAKNPQPVPYHRKPSEMSLEDWQIALRRQFVQVKSFGIENMRDHPVFSDFTVTNPENKNSYKVSIRDNEHSMNFCSCFDFKTNQLGTCKHIEAVIHSFSGNKKLMKIYLGSNQPEYTSVYLDYRGERSVKIRIGTVKNSEFTKLAAQYFQIPVTPVGSRQSAGDSRQSAVGSQQMAGPETHSLRPGFFILFETFLRKAAAIDSSFRCYHDALEFVLEKRDEIRRHKLIDESYAPYMSNGKFSKILNAKLFPYQKQGICFAVKAGRCLIADDMGLGKTIQALAAAEILKKEVNIGSVLVVCPTSLKSQWKTEIAKFTGSAALLVEGMPPVREKLYKEDAFYKIVSYQAFCNDIRHINNTAPDLVILDEAQRIKNFRTKVAQTVKKLNSRYAFVLTGTPLENKLEELYSIVQFVDPFRLGPLYRFLYDHQIRDEAGKVNGYQGLNNIGKVLQDIMIRRKKSEVLSQLPERMDKILVVPMTLKQAEWHNEYQEVVARLVAKWRRFGFLSEQERQKLLINLSLMRMVCDSTYIIDQETRHDTKIEELMNIIDEVVVSAEEKVVIFSQWERMTRLVAQELRERRIGFSYLHGGIPGHERGTLFESFSKDPLNRVFLSTDAGGVGLNLQSASIVINLDIPWNPAVLEQRIGRVHRLGQHRKVSVINMVSERTIEHRMLGVLKFKAGMAAGVLDGGEDAIFMGESSFRKFMRTVEDLTGSQERITIETDHLNQVPGQETVSGEAAMNTAEIKDFVSKGDIELEIRDTISGGPEPNETLQDSAKLSGDWLALIGEGEEEIPESDLAFVEAKMSTQINSTIGANKSQKRDTVPYDATAVKATSEAQSLLTIGLSFLTQLTRTLSDSNATQNLVKSLVHEDWTDGKTYLKIPIESEKSIHDLIELFAGLLIKSR